MNAMEIVKEIVTYIKDNGGKYFEWYAGIASDPRQRLFTEHSVKENSDMWIFAPAINSDTARATEQHLINALGTDGGPGGGDYSTRFVYAYKKATHTQERN